jgi:hypothetical protein
MHAIDESEEFVEAAIDGVAFLAGAEMPFADHARGIAGSFEVFAEETFAFGDSPVGGCFFVDVEFEAEALLVAAGEQAGSRGGT